MKLLPILGLLLLSACGQNIGGVQTLPAPKTADQVLYEAQVTLDGLVKQADLYAKLPRCGSVEATAICSTQSAAQSAYKAAVAVQSAINVARPLAVLATATPSDASAAQKAKDAMAAVTTALARASSIISQLAH